MQGARRVAIAGIASLMLAGAAQAGPGPGIAIEVVEPLERPETPFEQAALASAPLAPAREVLAFDPATGALTLTPRGAEQAARWREALRGRGLARFVLTADGERLLEGVIVPAIRSASDERPAIVLDELGSERLVVQRSYHGREAGPDPRQDPRLVAAALRLEARQRLRELLARSVAGYWTALRAGGERQRLDAATRPVVEAHATPGDVPRETFVRWASGEERLLARIAVEALAAHHAQDAGEALRAALAPGDDEFLRFYAALGLAIAGDPVGQDLLEGALGPGGRGFAMTASGIEHGQAALALAALGAVEQLEAVRARRDSPNVRAEVALALRALEATLRARQRGPH